MFLHEVFPPELIKVNMEAEDKDEAFEELVDHLCQVEHSGIREEVLGALREREAKMSTGIHKGIAIPHGKTNALDDIKGVLGISKKGIDYDALDGEPVYLLFTILTPERDSEQHLHVLKRLVGLLNNPDFYNELAAQNDSQGAHRIIKKYEDPLTALD
ncbi:hypothetical protein AGMMS49928_08630 [Spirochaetia bacterium]|nr:hypothetical protein AGMMS49928_08630 [Spirochaetia bacterium]